MKYFTLLFLLFVWDASWAQDDCQYRRIEINDLDAGQTVLHVRTTRGDQVRYFGYHESGVYPWRTYFEWCGDGWLVEYRTGSECTVWAGDQMIRIKTPDGKRQLPCLWSGWILLDGGMLEKPKPPTIKV